MSFGWARRVRLKPLSTASQPWDGLSGSSVEPKFQHRKGLIPVESGYLGTKLRYLFLYCSLSVSPETH